jgi:hypothetical protein
MMAGTTTASQQRGNQNKTKKLEPTPDSMNSGPPINKHNNDDDEEELFLAPWQVIHSHPLFWEL